MLNPIQPHKSRNENVYTTDADSFYTHTHTHTDLHTRAHSADNLGV